MEFHTPEGNRAPILSFFAEKEKELATALRKKGVYVTGRRGKEGHMRVSPHFYNNEEDIDVFVNTFSEIAG
jgi:selenocysteine lyase/cysteine desulfurase